MTRPELLQVVAGWPLELQEWFSELAGKLEFCCHGMTREAAERTAFEALEKNAPKKQTTLDLEAGR